MRDRNHKLQIYLCTSNAKRFWKLQNGKITIETYPEALSNFIAWTSAWLNQKGYVTYNVTHDRKITLTILLHSPKYSATVSHGLQPG